jgi:hypothetical protein
LWGSVGFLVTVFISGAWFEAQGMSGFPYWAVLTLLAVNISTWTLPDKRESVVQVQGQAGFWQVLRQPQSLWFFATLFFHVLSHVSIYTFFSLYLDELGYGKDMIGILWAVSVIVEIMGFFTQSKWLHWLSLPAWLCVCTGLMVLRMGMTAFYAPMLPVLLLAQCLHVFTFAVQHTVCIAWLSKHFPGRLRGRGQALYAVIGYGFTGVIGALGGAALSTRFGLQQVFVMAASNTPWDLDVALLRRLEKRVLVPLPVAEAREAMLRKHLSPRAASDIDYPQLAGRLEGYSGADLELVCREAAMRPVRRIVEKLRAIGATEALPGAGGGIPEPPPPLGGRGGTQQQRVLRQQIAGAGTHTTSAGTQAEVETLLRADPVSAADVLAALDETKPSSDGNMDKYQAWQSEFGAV